MDGGTQPQKVKKFDAEMGGSEETENYRRSTNVQQLTYKIDSSPSFYYLFFSFVLLELKPFGFKWKVLGEKF